MTKPAPAARPPLGPPLPPCSFFTAATAVLLLSLPQVVDAGANAECLQAPSWIQKSYKIKDGTYSDFTQCQLDALLEGGAKFQPNNNLIGGDGDASLFDDIYVGGGGEGCQSTENCMKDCQALCCIVPTCSYAVIHRDEDTYCPMGEGTCSIYKEDAYYWYCLMFSGGTQKNTDDDTMCYVESSSTKSATCAAVAQEGMGWNASTYQSLLYLGSNCARRQAEEEPEVQAENAAASGDAPRSLAVGAKDIQDAVQGSLLGIRNMILPGVQDAVAADGGVKGFAGHLGKIAKTLSKGGGKSGKMGMIRKKQ